MDGRKHESRVLVLAILAASGAGAWISGQLLKQHAALWGPRDGATGIFARVCDATEGSGLDCAHAAKGRWSQIEVSVPLPSRDFSIAAHPVVMPVAFLGLAYFVFMAVWFAFIGRPRPYGRKWHRVPLAVGFFGVAVSLFFLGMMALGLAPRCVWCLAVHALNLLTVCAMWRLVRRAPDATPTLAPTCSAPQHIARLTLTSSEATTVIAVSLIIIAGLWAYHGERLALQARLNKLLPYKAQVAALRRDPAFLLREHHAQQRREIPPRSGEPVGDDRPQLVVFTDFECRACYCNSLAVQEQIAAAFAGRLAVRVRHYPLCRACNENVETELHPNACEAAYAAEAARLQGGDEAFWRMHDLLFENRKDLGNGRYRELAARIGLDVNRFLRDFDSDTVRRIVRDDIALARKLGVEGTPTMFLNGRRITAFGRDNPVFWEAVAQDWSASHRRTLMAADL